MVTVLFKNAEEMAPLRSHLDCLAQRIGQLQEANDKVCRKNEVFQKVPGSGPPFGHELMHLAP